VFSGYVSDRIVRRKPLIILGYGMAALTKPLFAQAHGAGLVLDARFADRIGKPSRSSGPGAGYSSEVQEVGGRRRYRCAWRMNVS
jgi:hypothetical protein